LRRPRGIRGRIYDELLLLERIEREGTARVGAKFGKRDGLHAEVEGKNT
jgi:hypothetical protein